MKVAAIIPSLNPDGHLLEVVRDLSSAGFRIFLVDDGSGPAYAHLFEEAAQAPGCTLLRHEENKGKGRALKTAFAAFLEECPDSPGVVTVDADGQHKLPDIRRCAEALQENPDALILGVRDFSGQDIPARSMFGNRVTRGVFRFLCGLRVSDTQTGLRAIPTSFCRVLANVAGERYEFETNMLLETKKHLVPLREVPIATIYIEENAASHFNPLRDSLRIYALIFKFLSASLVSFFIDIALFALLYRLLLPLPESSRILAATAGARACSSLFNFFVNRGVVFASRSRLSRSMPRYYLLCAAQMLVSWQGVNLLVQGLGFWATPAKLLVDGILMIASFSLQRGWVFREESHREDHI